MNLEMPFPLLLTTGAKVVRFREQIGVFCM